MIRRRNAGRGRDLGTIRLEIVGNAETTVASSVVCPRRDRTTSLESCRCCEDTRGDSRDPGGRTGYLECVAAGCGSTPASGAEARSAAHRTPIARLVAREAVALRADLPLARAREVLLSHGLSAAAVVDDAARPIGVLTERDLLRGDDARGGTRVGTAVARRVLAVPDGAPVAEAAALMAREGVEQLPVLGCDGRLVGMVAAVDVLRWATQHEACFLPTGRALLAR